MTNGKGRRTDEFGVELHERKSDSDYIARTTDFVNRFKLHWLIVAAGFAWYSANILEPAREGAKTTAEVKSINAKIDEKIMPRLDSADADRARMIRVQETQTRQLGIMSRFLCSRISPEQRIVIDVDCKDIPISTPKGGE